MKVSISSRIIRIASGKKLKLKASRKPLPPEFTSKYKIKLAYSIRKENPN